MANEYRNTQVFFPVLSTGASKTNSRNTESFLAVVYGLPSSAASLSAGGSITVSGRKGGSSSTPLSGAGVIATADRKHAFSLSTLSASGVIATTGRKHALSLYTLSASGVIATTDRKHALSTASVAGSGDISVYGYSILEEVWYDSASLSATGAINASTRKVVRFAATLAGVGNAAVETFKQSRFGAVVSAAGAINLSFTRISQSAANLRSAGAIRSDVVDHRKVAVSAASISCGNAILVISSIGYLSPASVVGSGAIAVAGRKQARSAALLTTQSRIAANSAKLSLGHPAPLQGRGVIVVFDDKTSASPAPIIAGGCGYGMGYGLSYGTRRPGTHIDVQGRRVPGRRTVIVIR